MNKNIVVPVEVCIKRYYRTYVHTHEGATDEEIVKAAQEQVIEEQDCTLNLDPDLEIEEGDIVFIEPDYEGIMMESDIKEIAAILAGMEED